MKNIIIKPGFLIGIVILFAFFVHAGEEANCNTASSANILSEVIVQSDSPVKPYDKNPWYWEYKDEPVMLIGASDDDNLFQMENVEEHLDLMVAHGGNYLRCTMSSRDEGNSKPYRMVQDHYNLQQPNPTYWHKFREFLKLTEERDIIVQVELWATYDFYGGWPGNVFNPKNNTNYSSQSSALPGVVEHTAQLKINPFFETVPQISDNKEVLSYQQQFVDEVLSYTFNHDNVLYCIDNETNARPEWAAYWARYVRDKAEKANKRIFITEMWDNWDPTDGNVEGVRQQEHASHPFLGRSKVANTINAPELYDFVDISNNNAQNGEVHYKSALYVRNWIEKTGKIRPVNNVKIYGGTIYETYTRDWAGSYKDGEERFWRDAFAGHASIRFHRPPFGQGLNVNAQFHIRSMRMLTDSMDLFKHEPANHLLSDRSDNEAFCLAMPGNEYALYFPGEGKVKLDVDKGLYEMRWLHIRSATWRNAQNIENPEIIETPDNDQWVVLIRKI